MTKEFIPYEQALALKELEFDESCFGVYQPEMDGKYYLFSINVDDIGSNNSDCIEFIKCTAPLYQQAFRWFREKYGIVGIVKFGTQEFTYNIYNNDAIGLLTKDSLDFNGTYEEAEIACLKKLIEIVKTK